MARKARRSGSAGVLGVLWLATLVSCKEVPDLLPKCKTEGVDTARALDLVDRGRDPNGILLAPSWNIQEAQGSAAGRTCTAEVLGEKICGGFPRIQGQDDPGSTYGGRPSCSTQTTADRIGHWGVNDDLAHHLFDFVSYLGPLGAHRPDWRHALLGHLNWRPVTFRGWLSFDESGSADRDVNFALEIDPDGGAPFTSKQLAADSTLAVKVGHLHLEVQADQSVHHFGDSQVSEDGHRPTDVPRFVQLARATDNPAGREELRKHLWRKRAVATGLLALDLDHEIFSELHPLYSVAWQDSCADNTETWAYLFASRGAQGWVSSGLNHSMALPAPAFTVELPTRFQGATTSVDAAVVRAVAQQAKVDLRSNATRQVEYSITSAADRGRVDLTVSWPGAEPSDEVRVHGTVTLSWPPGVIECPAVPPSGDQVRPAARPLPPHRVEEFGERLTAELKTSARAGQPTPPGAPESTEATDCPASPRECDDVVVKPCSTCDAKWASAPPCPAGEVCDYLDKSPTRAETLLRAEDEKALCDRLASIAPRLATEFPKLEWKCPAN